MLSIDRNRLLKELPETAHPEEQQQMQVSAVGPIQRPIQNQEIWMGGIDPGISNLPPIFPGPGSMMAQRGGGRGVLGLMGMPRGMGAPPLHRPVMAPLPGHGLIPPKSSEEDELKDLEALLSKKSFMELQKSKTGEELLDLIHRPTAKETAVAAKVLVFIWA